jgi:hypothetical protein
MYKLGDGIKQNLEKALKFYKQVVNELGKEEFRNTREKVAELTECLKQQQEGDVYHGKSDFNGR